MTTFDETKEKCKEVQEMTERKLPWILRSGITVIFVLVTGLLILSCFIKYPEKVSFEFTLTEEDEIIKGVSIVSQDATGKLKNNMQVLISFNKKEESEVASDTCYLSISQSGKDSCTLYFQYPSKTKRGTTTISTSDKAKGEIIISDKYLINYFIDQIGFLR